MDYGESGLMNVKEHWARLHSDLTASAVSLNSKFYSKSILFYSKSVVSQSIWAQAEWGLVCITFIIELVVAAHHCIAH